jgi:flagellar hook-associated protein 2
MMATISSTTSTTATTAPAATTTPNIATALGAGSGVDTTALVKSLVDAQFAGKTARLTKQSDALTAQISAVTEVKSGISLFASALASLVGNGSLTTQLSSSGSGVKASAIPGARVGNVGASINVTKLATAQVAVTRTAIAADAAVGSGTLQLKLGSIASDGSFAWDGKDVPAITISAGEGSSLQSVASKINNAKAGVTASIVSDANGQRLVLKGATGATQAFTLSATPDSTDSAGGLNRLNVDFSGGSTGAQITTQAGNAEMTVDGIALSSATNSVTGAIPGVKLDLQSITNGVPAQIGSSTPIDGLKQAVDDVVATFNEVLSSVQKATDPVSGALKTDPAAAALKRSLAKLTLTPLTTAKDGSPTTLSEIGVSTNRNGTLSVDSKLLAQALAKWPDAIGAMFAPDTSSSGTGIASGAGLSAALNAIKTTAASTTLGLGASADRYTRAQKTLTDEQTKLTTQSAAVSTRMTQQFSASEARVAAYKAQQTFMENQMKMWSKDG